jgi:hypothetical protein
MTAFMFLLGYAVVIGFVVYMRYAVAKVPTCDSIGESHKWAWGQNAQGFNRLRCGKCGMIFGDSSDD